METFPGNFYSICYCFQIFEIFGWKASKVTICPYLWCSASRAKRAGVPLKQQQQTRKSSYSPEENEWQCREYTRLEITAIFFSFRFSFFLFSLFPFFVGNETRSSQSYSATSEQRAIHSWYASIFRLPRIPKNVWNGCTGAKVRITFSYFRSEGFNIAVEINCIKMA